MELGQTITCALDHLGELDRQVIELRYGLSGRPREAAETAELLGISIDEVQAREAHGLETVSMGLVIFALDFVHGS
jgi:DNA-directed RNA polymerase specialized sigma24 family protein